MRSFWSAALVVCCSFQLPARAQSEYALHFLRGHQALASGELTSAEAELERAADAQPFSPACTYALATCAALRGERDLALTRLRLAAEQGYLDADVALWDPDLERLRDLPEFREVLSMMRAVPEGQVEQRTIPPAERGIPLSRVGLGWNGESAFVRTGDHRTWKIDLRSLSAERTAWTKATRSFDRMPSVSADGRRLLSFHEDGLRLWQVVRESRETLLLAHCAHFTDAGPAFLRANFSPDGSTFVRWNGDRSLLEFHDSEDGSLRQALDLSCGGVNAFEWAADSTTWFAGSRAGVVLKGRFGAADVQRFPLPSLLSPEDDCSDCTEEINDLALSPRGDQLVVAQHHPVLRVIDPDDGTVLATPLHDLLYGQVVLTAEFNPEGTRLVTSTWSVGSSVAWNTSTWGQAWFVGEYAGTGAPHFAAWDSAGERVLAYGQLNSKARIIDGATGEVLHALESLNVYELHDPGRNSPLLADARVEEASFSHLLALDRDSAQPLWRMHFYTEGKWLAVASEGVYSGSPEIRPHGKDQALERLLLDPKRVRAHAAGVTLRRPNLERLATSGKGDERAFSTVPEDAFAESFRRGQSALDEGRLTEAEEALQRAAELEAGSASVAYAQACVAALKREESVALHDLNRAVDLGYPDADVALWDEQLKPLRDHPGFAEVLERMRALEEGAPLEIRAAEGDSYEPVLGLGRAWRGDVAVVALPEGELGCFGGAPMKYEPLELTPALLEGSLPFYSPDARRALTLHEDRVRLWMVGTGGDHQAFKDYARRGTYRPLGVFSPDSQHFVLHSADSPRLEVFDARGGDLVQGHELSPGPLSKFGFSCFDWQADSRRWCAGTNDGRFFAGRLGEAEVREGKISPTQRTWPGKPVYGCTAIAWSPGGGTIVVGSDLETRARAYVYRASDLVEVAALTHDEGFTRIGELHFNRSGSRLAVSTHNSGMTWMWDAKTWRLLWSCCSEIFGNGSAHHVRWSQTEEQVFAFGQHPMKARVLDARTGELLRSLEWLQVWNLLELSEGQPVIATASRLSTRGEHLLVLDPQDSSLRGRVFPAEGGALLLTDSAYYDGPSKEASLARLQVGESVVPLLDYEAQLLDPKRVRARLAGVRIRFPRLR